MPVRQLCYFSFLAYAAVTFCWLAPVTSARTFDGVAPATSEDSSNSASTIHADISIPHLAPRKALVIGIRNYDFMKELPSGQLDAKTFSQKLKDLRFSVISSIDEDAYTIWKKIAQFELSVEPGDVALFYYSGHGFQHNGLNFMTARDTPKPIPAEELLYKTVPLDDIVGRLRKSKAGFSLILIDACRENTSMIEYSDGTRKAIGNGGLASVRTPPPNMVMGFATYFGKTAQSSTDPNKNSIYTRYLNLYIDQEDTEIVDILRRYVGQEVYAVQPGQVPETRVLPSGYFYPKRGTFIDAVEKNTWNKAINTDTYDSVERFVWHWPVGRYAAHARTWLSENQDRENAVATGSSIKLSAEIESKPVAGFGGGIFGGIVAGIVGGGGPKVDTTGYIRRLDTRGLNINGPFVKPSHMASHNALTNIARVERDFLAYVKPDARSKPIATILPGQSVRVTNLLTPDASDPANYFTEVEINPNSKYTKKVFIKDAFAFEKFWDYPLWVTIELKPMSDEDALRDDVRLETITHRYIGKSNLETLDINASVGLLEIRPYIENILKSFGSKVPPDMESAFADVELVKPGSEGRGVNTRNALFYLRNLQVSNSLQKIGLKRENIVINEIAPKKGEEENIENNPVDRIQIFLPSVN